MASAASGSQDAQPEVLVEYKGSVACVTLNRPKALNSLSTVMVERLLQLNTEFSRHQPAVPVSCVVVRGAGGKAFCAGGDVKELVLRARAGDPQYGVDFFRAEYANNAAIAQLPVPYIAVLDGIVMGGGVGVSMHGHFRIATERSMLAMPETGIGLFPDVGASFFLPRLPGHLGRYMGLTGERLHGREVKDAGFATHFVPSAALPDLEARLAQLGPRAADLAAVDALLRQLEQHPQPPPASAAPGAAAGGQQPGGEVSALLRWKLPLINSHFGCGSAAEVVASLEAAVREVEREDLGDAAGRRAGAGAGAGKAAAGGAHSAEARAFLRNTLAALKRVSPLSQAVTWEMLRRSTSRHLGLRACLEMEFTLAARFTRGEADFHEGVRALLIDKNSRPGWRYGSVGEVPEAVVRALFEPLTEEPPLFGGAAAGTAVPAARM